MQTDPDPKKDTSKPGREEEVITNSQQENKPVNAGEKITNLPEKDQNSLKETEGERRFKEGLANNDDATTPN